MDNIDKARELGYEVELAIEDAEGKKHYRVKGQGVDTIYAEDQEDAWNFLVDPKAHEHRANMYKHNDPDDEFTMTDEEIRESSIEASLSAGLLDEDQAKEMRDYQKAAISS
jgi:hypothetical protein